MKRKSILGVFAVSLGLFTSCTFPTRSELGRERTTKISTIVEYLKEHHTIFSRGSGLLVPEMRVTIDDVAYTVAAELDMQERPQMIYIEWQKKNEENTAAENSEEHTAYEDIEAPENIEDYGNIEDIGADGICDEGRGFSSGKRIYFNKAERTDIEYESDFQEVYDNTLDTLIEWMQEHRLCERASARTLENLHALSKYMRTNGKIEQPDNENLFTNYQLNILLQGNTENLVVAGVVPDTLYTVSLTESQQYAWLPKIFSIQITPVIGEKFLEEFFIKIEDNKLDGTCDFGMRFTARQFTDKENGIASEYDECTIYPYRDIKYRSHLKYIGDDSIYYKRQFQELYEKILDALVQKLCQREEPQ